jgi:broad specificity phosphatase PhoE
VRTLLVIRHGQASVDADEYDVLSPRGHEQSRRLSRWLVENGYRPAVLAVGPRRRHQETARALVENGDWPAPLALDGLDELPFREIMLACMPEWTASDAELRAVVERGDVRGLQALFVSGRLRPLVGQTLGRWRAGKLVGSFETFVDFRARVEHALDEASAAAPDGATVAVVTSGGPIGVALARVRSADARAFGRGLQHHNTGVTELSVDGAWELVAEDQLAHLPPELVTSV